MPIFFAYGQPVQDFAIKIAEILKAFFTLVVILEI